jgi:hypothetical protein
MPVQTWSAAFQATPAGSDQVSEGDDRIRELKETIQAELEPEHDVGTIDAAYNDNGRHKLGSARSFFQSGVAAVPAALQKPDGTNEVDKTPPSGVGTLDNGRLWVDWDDAQPFTREQTQVGGSWTDINTNHGDGAGGAPGVPAANWLSLWPRSWTDVHPATVDNERPGAPTDDTRDTITGMSGQSIVIPDDGRSYELVVRAVIKYQIDPATPPEHGAFWIEETAPAAADRDMAYVVSATNNEENPGVVVLEYVYTAPTNGTTYTFDVDFAGSEAATFYVNPDDTVINGGPGGIYAPAATQNRSNLFLTVRPRYLVATYTQV